MIATQRGGRGALGLLLALALLAAAPAPKRDVGQFVTWWKNDKLARDLGLDDVQRKQLTAELENLQVGYQLAQTRLNEARTKQSAMMIDPAVDRAALVAFHQAEIAPPTDAMQQANFDARLAVRSRLRPDQLAAIGRDQPLFFSARWFKTSRVPVREGRVVIEDE